MVQGSTSIAVRVAVSAVAAAMTMAIVPMAVAQGSPRLVETASIQSMTAAPTRTLAATFYDYVLPILEIARRRDVLIAKNGANAWAPTRKLADANFREVTTPNNDTIYAMAFLDLRNGPARITVPATGKRYVSIHLMDLYSNAIGYAGTRVGRGEAEAITIVGPATTAPRGAGRVIRSPTPWVWAISRVLVTGPKDLAAAITVQNAITVVGAPAGLVPPRTPADDADPAALRAAAARLIADNPPPAADAPALSTFRDAGLLDPAVRADATVAAGFADARTRSRALRRPGQVVAGWIYPKTNLGDYGTDYAYRASVAVNGLGAMTPVEAMYLRSAASTPTGLFDGNRLHRLHFAAGQLPPVDAFWSLSLYERTADGGFYFVANPLARYAIGDRTLGLTRNADGSLDLWISHADPGPARRANWLPAPAGPFALSLRAYLPREELRSGRWHAPAVEIVE